jgi:hypothetical protein
VQPSPSQDEHGNRAEHGNTSNPQASNESRPKVSAKRQGGRIHRPITDSTRPNLASEVVTEEFDNPEVPKPKGYLGTIAGARICASTVEDYCPCGTGGGHYLVCGHNVVSDSGDTICGSNCKTGLHTAEPFICPNCHVVVKHILDNKLSPEENASIAFHFARQDAQNLAIMLSVEYVSKYTPTKKGNVASTLLSIALPQYGRACLSVPNEPIETTTLASMFQEYHDILEQNSRAREAEINNSPLNTHEKRKVMTEEHHTPIDTPSDSEASQSPEVVAVAEKVNKKQKRKLATYPEPITEPAHGVKRIVDEADWSDPETLVGSDSPSPTKKSTKKQKQKHELVSHPEPVTSETHGEKRPLNLLGTFYSVFYERANKRPATARLTDIGDASFLPVPAGLAKLERKRGNNANADTYINKCRCSWEVFPSKMADNDALFTPEEVQKRLSIADYIAMSSDDEF